jgi:ABC-type nitrate/sulfonate/bicarbonate transport system permease component
MARATWQPIRILGKGPWSLLPAQTWSVLTDFVIFAAGLSLFYVILMLGRTWLGPFNPHVEISRDPSHLPIYAAYSLLRITVAYVLSLGFTLVYGYVAAYNPKAERIMIPLLDILQSIPVLRLRRRVQPQSRAHHDSAARYSAVHSGAQLSAGSNAGNGGTVSASPDWG